MRASAEVAVLITLVGLVAVVTLMSVLAAIDRLHTLEDAAYELEDDTFIMEWTLCDSIKPGCI